MNLPIYVVYVAWRTRGRKYFLRVRRSKMAGKNKKSTYDKLTDAVSWAYSSTKNKFQIQEKTNKIWNDIKLKHKVPGVDRDQDVDIEIKKLIELGNRRKAQNSNFFAQVSCFII